VIEKMYEACFQLRGRPFLSTTQVERYFPAAAIESARQTLTRCIERGEGAGLLVGPAGTGKTLLCQILARQFDDRFAVALLTSGRLATRSALLQAILYELKLPYRGLDEGELRLSLLDFLEPTAEGPAGLLLIVDEAHTLPLRLLEEIRMITNLVRDGQPRVRVVLAGGPMLEERFASPKLVSFSQRLAARCYLEPLNAADTSAYVRAQITAVGGDPDKLIDQQALRTIYRASDGIPRLINQICDHALILASLGGAESLSSEAIEEAWADLQQLPTPFNPTPDESIAGGVVEFGTLDDTADLPEAIPFRSATEPPPLHVARGVDAFGETDPASAGAGGPSQHGGFGAGEVDLDFPEFADTFGEQFEEEEVVLDRFASDVEIFADVPRVTSWEGRQLGSMLEPLDIPSPRATRPEPAKVKLDTTHAQGEPLTTVLPLGSLTAPEIVCAPPAGFTLEADLPAGGRTTVVADEGSTFWAGARRLPEERELLVVENDVLPPAPQPPRKREYRQLFAKLRRG
jgi:type II secretory pathway predicted ATPase ExeA